MKKLIVLMLIIYLLISMVGCGGVPTTPPIISSELVVVQVTDPKSNLISVAGKENEDVIAILGEKDIEGNPTDITGAVYVFEQGDSFGIYAGIDGLPICLIDFEGNKVLFENYTNSTVDISIYDSNGDLIQEPITINIDSADLLELKQLYNSFYSQKKGWGKNVADDVAAGLRWGAKAIPWGACVVTIGVAYVNPLLILLPPFSVTTISCGNVIIPTLISFLDDDFTIEESQAEGLTAVECNPANPLCYLITALLVIADVIEEHFGTNFTPIISSLTANPSIININETTTITCTASDENVGDTLTYNWNKNGGIFEGSTSGSSIIWRAPSIADIYTVSCEVSDGELSDTQSSTITVEETSTTLGQVQLSSPSNGTTVNTSTVTLSWDFVPGGTGYEVVYDTSSSFTNPIGWSVSGTSKTTGTLTDGTTYYWHVRAFAGSQYSSWSSVWSFTKSGVIVPQDVTLTLYICENSTSGTPLSGVSVGISDGGGNSFSQTTNSSGYVTITGTPGTWFFSAMKSGYDINSWSQSITTNCTKYG